jgi:CSLREA domain-containing protein
MLAHKHSCIVSLMHRFLAAAVVMGALALPATATADTFRVTSTADTPVGVACADPAACSLRGAITAANALSTDDTVSVDPGTYHLDNGQLSITDGTFLQRAGTSGTVTIDADGLSRVLVISADTTLENLTITDGRATDVPGGGPGADGGGIYATADIALDGVTLTANHADSAGVGDAAGGGLYIDGQLSVGGGTSTFSDNSVTATGTDAAAGGAIYLVPGATGNLGRLVLRDNHVTAVDGAAGGGGLASVASGTIHLYSGLIADNTVTASGSGNAAGGGVISGAGTFTVDTMRFTGNTAHSSAGDAHGGGMSTNGTPTMDATTFDANQAITDSGSGSVAASGGGLYSVTFLSIVITNSTFTANGVTATGAATANGGGLVAGFGPATLTGVTVTGNTATNTVTPVAANGGGATMLGASFAVTGSILSGNTQGYGPDCLGAANSGGGNVLFSTAGPANPNCPITLGTDDALTDGPGLGALGDHGGATPTMVPDLTSPAVDRYAAALGACSGLTIDQRGIARPQGSTCDAGAVEGHSTPGGGGGASTAGGGIPQCRDLDASTGFATPVGLTLDCSATVWGWQISTPPAHGTVSAIGPAGRLTYTPADGFSGDDSFQYVAPGDGGSSTPATAVVHVGPGPLVDVTSRGTAKACTPRTVTVRLNAHGVRYTRVRVSVAGVRVKPKLAGTVWKATFALNGTPGQKVAVHVSARRTDGRLVTTTRTLTAC